MKKDAVRFLIFTLLVFGLNACSTKEEKTNKAATENASSTSVLTDSLHAKGSKQVDSALAMGCVNEYYTKMSTLKSGWDTTKSNPKLTLSVGFNFIHLKNWIDSFKTPLPDNMRVVFGVYTKDYCNKYFAGDLAKEGRLTVFLWPYKKTSNISTLNKSADEEEEPAGDPMNIVNLIP